MTPKEFINQIIENTLATANNATANVDTAADRVLDLSEGRSMGTNYYVPTHELTAVEPDVPAVENSLLTYDAQLSNLIGLLSGQLAGYFTTYYPLTSDAFDEAQSWLINTITNGGTGIPAAVEEQIWQRARSRIIKDGTRVAASITSSYSARGFSLPQGPMVHDLNQARYEQASKIGEASTTIATKQAEIVIESIKFAITNAIDCRFKAMSSASDYIRSLMTAPDAASRLAGINTDAKAKMMAATSDLYRARLTRDQLVLGSQDNRMSASVQHEQTWLNAIQRKIDGNVLAASSAADAYAKVAASALSSLNSIVSTGQNSFS